MIKETDKIISRIDIKTDGARYEFSYYLGLKATINGIETANRLAGKSNDFFIILWLAYETFKRYILKFK